MPCRAGGAVQPTPQGATPATAPTAPAPLPSAMPATAPATAPATRSQAGRATGSGAPPSVGPSADAQRVARPTAVEQPSGSTGAGTAPRQPVMPVQQRSNEECLFLDCVHFHCVGWSESEMLKVRELAAEGGAIREPDLVPRVTHVIVGLEPAGDQLQALRDHMAEWREHVRVVKLQWLRDAVAARACIEPSPEQCFTVAQLMPQKSMALVRWCNSPLFHALILPDAQRHIWPCRSCRPHAVGAPVHVHAGMHNRSSCSSQQLIKCLFANNATMCASRSQTPAAGQHAHIGALPAGPTGPRPRPSCLIILPHAAPRPSTRRHDLC